MGQYQNGNNALHCYTHIPYQPEPALQASANEIQVFVFCVSCLADLRHQIAGAVVLLA